MVGIVDYNAGNIKSVERALDFLKIEYVLSKNPGDFKNCDRLIFPGVGDASYAMKQLEITGLGSFLKDWAAGGKLLLGICLGSQIIFDWSQEGGTKCLGLVPGVIKHFDSVFESRGCENRMLKIPHMGWNSVRFANGGCGLFREVPKNTDFYFVHSYVIQPDDLSVVKGYAEYGIEVPACIQSKNIYAFQFHPEKSGAHGLRLLENFCALKTEELC